MQLGLYEVLTRLLCESSFLSNQIIFMKIIELGLSQIWAKITKISIVGPKITNMSQISFLLPYLSI